MHETGSELSARTRTVSLSLGHMKNSVAVLCSE